MHNTNIPDPTELPSKGKLIKSTILAIIIAAIILITVVLPAEYGIDPTRVGSLLGLTKMGEIKMSLAAEAANEENMAAMVNTIENQQLETKPTEIATPEQTRLQADTITFTLEPNEGKEIKMTLAKGESLTYDWRTDGGKANFDAHADSKKLEIKYHNYEKGSLPQNSGVLEAAFDGNHGWFWRNRTNQTMTVTLAVEGPYTEIVQY